MDSLQILNSSSKPLPRRKSHEVACLLTLAEKQSSQTYGEQHSADECLEKKEGSRTEVKLTSQDKHEKRAIPKVHNEHEEGGSAKKKKQLQQQNVLANKDFAKAQWTREVKADISRLPSTYHILFLIVDRADEDKLKNILKDETGITQKLIKSLGCFIRLRWRKESEGYVRAAGV